MNFLKDFPQFIVERSDARKKLFQLGLASRNERFISDIERIIDLCPNLSYVTYPDKFSGRFFASKKVPMPNFEIEKAHAIMARLEEDDKVTPEFRNKFRDLSNRYRFMERLKLVTDLARKEYDQGFLDEIDSYLRERVIGNIREMIDELKTIDAEGTADLYIWNISGYGLPYTYFYGAKQGNLFDSKKILQILEENPENCKKVSHLEILATSPEPQDQSDFAKRMSRGDYGSLD